MLPGAPSQTVVNLCCEWELKTSLTMITLVETLNYRCLRYVKRRLQPFHVLIGPNASGKTTFMDIVDRAMH